MDDPQMQRAKDDLERLDGYRVAAIGPLHYEWTPEVAASLRIASDAYTLAWERQAVVVARHEREAKNYLADCERAAKEAANG